MYENLWLIPLGFAAGILGSIVGLGGGIIAVPVMTFAGFSPSLAASNSLFAAFSNSVASTVSYARQKRVEFGIGIKLGLMCIPGTVLGAFVSDVMTPVIFQILFAFVLIASAIYIFVKRAVDEKPYNKTALMMIISAGASLFAGIISSLFGIDGDEEWKNRQTRFVRPVYTDQVIRLKFTISDKRDIDEEYGLISVDFEATFEGGELVLTSKKNLYRIKKEPPTNR
ncbi:TSUP family transporter [Candidatus Nitrosopelagicus sp.]|nr:TSUP family transporter [Candidatus Nitrosopelagicus sp.]